MNRICLIGRLAADPRLRYTQDGVAVSNFVVAVERPYSGSGERGVDFIPVVAWRKLGEVVASNLTKGRLVGIEGRLQVRDYEAQGERRRIFEVVADEVRFLDRPKGQEDEKDSGKVQGMDEKAARFLGGGGSRTQASLDMTPDDVPF